MHLLKSSSKDEQGKVTFKHVANDDLQKYLLNLSKVPNFRMITIFYYSHNIIYHSKDNRETFFEWPGAYLNTESEDFLREGVRLKYIVNIQEFITNR